MRKLLMAGVMGAALAGCSWLEPGFNLPAFGGDKPLAPDDALFVSPTVVGSWQVADHALMERPADGKWWAQLNLPGLDGLMAQAMDGNPDLQAMAARVKQSRAEADVVASSLFPSIGAEADVTRGRSSPGQLGLSNGSTVKEGTLYGTGLTASYEPDLFGLIGSESRASRLLARADDALYENFKLIVQGQVVRAWVDMRAAQDSLDAWRDTLADAEARQKISDLRYQAGELAVGDWQGGLASLQNVRAAALNAAAARQHAANALAILVGQVPQGYVVPKEILAGTWGPVPVVPEGISSSVLLRRPDVKAAALQLEAANANIGAARAAFFPRLTLTASGGFASGDLGDMFAWGNRTWSAGPVLTLPIFQGGALRANLRRSWAVYEQGVAAYKGTVLGAFRDVADGLTDARTARLQADSFGEALGAASTALRATEARYKLGDAGKAEWLAARINARQAAISEAGAHAQSYAAAVRLIQSLGGGW